MLRISCGGHTPLLKSGSYAAPNATAVGDLVAEEGVSLWYGAVVRADQCPIRIGRDTNIQDNCILHVDPQDPMTIGQRVTVGHGAILHSCTVEDDCLIGMGAILMNRCVIGAGSLVAAGALVTEDTVVPPCSLVVGSPAKVRRSLTPEEQAAHPESARHYVLHAAEQLERME